MEDKNKYVSERIVNIAELETYIEKAYQKSRYPGRKTSDGSICSG